MQAAIKGHPLFPLLFLENNRCMHNQVGTRKEISPLLVYGKYHVMRLSEMIQNRSHYKRLQELH